MNIERAIEDLNQNLPALSRQIIRQNLDMSEELNQFFYKYPNSPDAHFPKWHQWGIITHTRVFHNRYHTEVPELLSAWSLRKPINRYLSTQIDNIPKKQLLELSIVLHDIGKFSSRQTTCENTLKFSFKDHEYYSAQLIQNMSPILSRQYGLTTKQVNYISDCAGLHYKLGNIRADLKKSNHGFNLSTVNSPVIDSYLDNIYVQYPDYAVEIGILYLGDSLAKNNFRMSVRTDLDIELQRPVFTEKIVNAKLPPDLIDSVKQMPVNTLLSRIYLTRLF